MITSEKAYDMLPYASDIYEKLDIKKFIEDKKIVVEEGENIETKLISVILDLGNFVLKESPKIKSEVFNIVAILEDKTMEEVLAQSPIKTIRAFKSIFEDKETLDFLTQVVKQEDMQKRYTYFTTIMISNMY